MSKQVLYSTAPEDFYYMEKLAKNVKISSINSTTVCPSSRRSWRVPFGTGQRMNRFYSRARDEYLLYNSGTFVILKDWIKVFCSNEISTSAKYMEQSKEIHTELYHFLQIQKFEENWGKILKNSKTEEQINKQKIKWFDGFRTLKLIHHLRDFAFPEINMFAALDAFFILLNKEKDFNRKKPVPELEVQRDYLIYLRELESLIPLKQ